MNPTGLGLDIIEVKRFKKFKNKNNHFLSNNFSPTELDYCFSFKDFVVHLASTFAAKEAVFKALGKTDFLFSAIEIRHDKNGRPTAWLKNRQHKNILLSISHTSNTAMAVAIKI